MKGRCGYHERVIEDGIAPLSVARMTKGQLDRRARLIEAVVELIEEVGAEDIQIRDVAERSGVALGTIYKYFGSKDHLLAAALSEWQQRLTRRVLASSGGAAGDHRAQLSAYIREALKAFHRHPEKAALMIQMLTSHDPNVVATVVAMGQTNRALLESLLHGIAAEEIPIISFALDAALMSAVAATVTGQQSLRESTEKVEGTARLLIGNAKPSAAPTRRQAKRRTPA